MVICRSSPSVLLQIMARSLDHAPRRDFTRTAMPDIAAAAFSATGAGRIAVRLDYRRQRVERSPKPRIGGPENTDGGGPDGRRNMHQAGVVGYREVGGFQRDDGVAQVVAGEIARAIAGVAGDVGR